eukprot:TRINITY_DN43562_c0_g1_i1.p1 TRINITY_DN43562_c0_g1~~TRINITY_DN43562_c0_g1_i1.p1  ORF type:complete len:686 (+),score=114.78 TRINITY_DN43562_c0_g1_i1:152-2059(+)
MPGGNLWYELLESRSRSSKGLDQKQLLNSLLKLLGPEERDRILSDRFEADCMYEFDKFDEDHSGSLDGQELCCATVGCLSPAFARRIGRGAKLRRLALAFDVDGDGLINKTEFVLFIRFCMALEVREYFTRSCLKKCAGVWTVGCDGEDVGLPAGGIDDVEEPALPSDENIMQVSVGSEHMLALQEDGDVFAWGSNAQGQLGLGDDGQDDDVVDPPQPLPFRVVMSMVAAGENFSCFVDMIGWCWTCGANNRGQLGTGDTTPRREPWRVRGIKEAAVVIDCFMHTLVVTADGNVWAWGENDRGQLGLRPADDEQGRSGSLMLPSTSLSETPVRPRSQPRSFEVTPKKLDRQASGKRFARAGTDARPTTPALPIFEEIVGVACGGHHSLALASDGRLFAWGQASRGQLGLGEEMTEDQPVPCLVSGDYGHDFYVCHLAAGASHSACIAMPFVGATGTQAAASVIHCFGSNDLGQCVARSTRGAPVFSPAPPSLEADTEAFGGRRKLAVACGADFTLCVTDDRRVWMWGRPLTATTAYQHASLLRPLSPPRKSSSPAELADAAESAGLSEDAGVESQVFVGAVSSLQSELQISAVAACGRAFAAWRAPVAELLPPEEETKKKKARGSKAKAKSRRSK